MKLTHGVVDTATCGHVGHVELTGQVSGTGRKNCGFTEADTSHKHIRRKQVLRIAELPMACTRAFERTFSFYRLQFAATNI